MILDIKYVWYYMIELDTYSTPWEGISNRHQTIFFIPGDKHVYFCFEVVYFKMSTCDDQLTSGVSIKRPLMEMQFSVFTCVIYLFKPGVCAQIKKTPGLCSSQKAPEQHCCP